MQGWALRTRATRLLLTGEVVTGSDLESMKWGFLQDTENVLPFAI